MEGKIGEALRKAKMPVEAKVLRGMLKSPYTIKGIL